MWTTSAELLSLKLAITPSDSAVPDHVPSLALLFPEASAIQSEGRVRMASSPVGSSSEQSPVAAPEYRNSLGVVPIDVSTASRDVVLMPANANVMR
jgi:hypothetical protein